MDPSLVRRSGTASPFTTLRPTEAGSTRRKSKSGCSRGNASEPDEFRIFRPFVGNAELGIAVSTTLAPKSTGNSIAGRLVASSVTEKTLLSGQRPSPCVLMGNAEDPERHPLPLFGKSFLLLGVERRKLDRDRQQSRMGDLCHSRTSVVRL